MLFFAEFKLSAFYFDSQNLWFFPVKMTAYSDQNKNYFWGRQFFHRVNLGFECKSETVGEIPPERVITRLCQGVTWGCRFGRKRASKIPEMDYVVSSILIQLRCFLKLWFITVFKPDCIYKWLLIRVHLGHYIMKKWS